MYILIEILGDYKRVHRLGKANTIGRALDNTVSLRDSLVSRQHAEILQDDDGRWIITDLGSSFGTHVCRKRIDTHVLNDGDEIIMGTTRLYFDQAQTDESSPFRRWEERITCDIPVEVTLGYAGVFSGRGTNLSIGGMSVALDKELEEGALITLSLPVPDRAEHLTTRARVAHGGSTELGWGLAFLFHSEEDRDSVARLYRELLLDAKD